jgi:hypothetical protein
VTPASSENPPPLAADSARRELLLAAANGWAITVQAPAAELAWLDEVLCPPFRSRRSEPAPGGARVELLVDPRRFDALPARDAWSAATRLPVFALDAGAVEAPTLSLADGELLVRDESYPVVYRIAPDLRRVELVSPAPDLRLRTPLLRVVRELLMGEIFAAGWPLLHASAIESAGRVLAFLGPTAAGKTSLLLHALGLPGARLLANDRLCVRADGGAAVAFTVPTIVTVRESGLVFFPAVAERLANSRFGHRRTLAECAEPDAPAPHTWSNGKFGLTPAQLAALADAERAESGELAAIVLPRHSGARGGLALRRLTTAEARRELREAQIGHGAWMRATALFRPRGVEEAAALAARDAQLDRLARSVPLYAADVGLDAYRQPDSLRRLAATLASGN